MPKIPAIKLAAFGFLAGATLAVAYTALGPAVNVEGGLTAPGRSVAGGVYSADYGPLYLRLSGSYLPAPPLPPHARDWPPPSPPTDDRGYATGEALGAYALGGTAGLGPGLYYKFTRGQRYYHKHIYGPTIESWMEDYVAFKYDLYAVATYRRRAEGKGTAVLWAGPGLFHFRRHGLRTYYYSDFYNPENYLEIITPLETRLTAVAAGAGVDLRSDFATHVGVYASARATFRLANIRLEGWDRDEPNGNIAFTGSFFFGW
jgi:hypothetical protein